MVNKEKIQFSVEIQKELQEKIDALKKHYRTQDTAELIKILVNEKAQQLTATEIPQNVINNNLVQKMPEELGKIYNDSRKSSPVVEGLKVAAALKLWDREVVDIRFDVPMVFGGKTVCVKVLAKHPDGTVFGVECASAVRPNWLRERLAVLQMCLPKDNYLIAVFPASAYEGARRVVKLADEVWVTGGDGKVRQMMFSTRFGKA